MKLKIVFCEPPAKEIKTAEGGKVVIVQSPHKIIQTELGDTREYEKPDGSKMSIGIPVILNMQDRGGCGHFEVVIGIEKSAKGEHIILAEPGTALVGSLEFEQTPKDKFIARWKSMNGEFHGRFMILSPNEASTHEIDILLADVPQYKNGGEMNRTLTNKLPTF